LKFSSQPLIKHVLFFLWMALSLYGHVHHVFWRDEVRALGIAISAESLWSLPTDLLNEGHPVLWYAILKIGYLLTGSTSILPITSFLFAAGFVFLLLYKSPFHWLLVTIAIFGYYGLHEYNINARNYGIAVFIMFLFAWLTRTGKNRFWGYFLLALLTQTNFYAMVMAGFLCGLYFIRHLKNNPLKLQEFIGVFMVLAACLFCVYTCLPTKDTLVVNNTNFATCNYYQIWDVGWGFPNLIGLGFDFKHGFFTTILLLCLLLFIKQPISLIFVFFSMVFMAFFHLNIRPNYSHHQGIWVFTFLTIVWLNYDEILAGVRKNNFIKILALIGTSAYLLIFISFLYKGFQVYKQNLKEPFSNAKYVGSYLSKHHTSDRIIIAEPDYTMESVVYYYNMPYFLIREDKYNRYTHFTKANKNIVGLDEVMNKYDSFEKLGKSPLLVLGWQIPKIASNFPHSYNKVTLMSENDLNLFHEKYKEIAHFDLYKRSDEVFYVYQKRKL